MEETHGRSAGRQDLRGLAEPYAGTPLGSGEAVMSYSAQQYERALLFGQKRVLEKIATGAPLDDTLAELTRFIEAQEEGLRCSILIVTDDGEHFVRGSGPRLPKDYHRALDGIPITPPYLEPCGQAAHQGVPIVVPDIAEDARWAASWRDMALSCGLAACRSTPIFASDGRVLGAFAMYYDRPRDPNPAHPQIIEIATHLAGIALKHDRLQAVLRERAKARQLGELLGALPVAVYTTDVAGRITYYNQAAVDLAGRRPTLGSDEWCVTWRLYRPDGRPMPHDQYPMAVALREDRPIRGEEAVAERPDGTRVPIIPYPTPLHDSSGTLIGAVNMLVDVSESKRAEALAECQRQALQMLGEGAPLDDVLGFLVRMIERHAANEMLGSILLLNKAGTHFQRGIGASLPEEFNKAVAGVAVSSAIGVCCHAVARREPVVVRDFSTDPQWARFVDFVAPYGLRAGWSTPIVGSDGKVLGTFANYYRRPCDPTPLDLRWVEIVTRTAAIAIERRLAEQELRESEEWQRTLIASSPLAIVVVDPEANVRLWNPAAEKLFGWSEAEVLGRGVPFVSDDMQPECMACRDTAMRGETFAIRTQRCRRDGSLVDVSLTAAPMRDAEGKIARILVVIEDDTERTRAKEVLENLNITLEQRIAERTRELEASVEERRRVEAALHETQRLEAIGQLTAGVAHDFNNLLTVVLGQSESIIKTSGDPRTTKMADMIRKAAGRGAQLTSQLLAFSRRQRLRPESVSVSRLIANIDDLLRRAVGETIAVALDIGADPWPSLVDPAQFESALLNLAINARDAMPDGGQLLIATRNTVVSGTEAERLDLMPGDYVVVSVTDTGAGMPPEVQRRAFEPFFTTKDVGKGTGLGLAQIHGFARQSGGTATITSGIGKGATVSLHLPRAVVPATEGDASGHAITTADGRGSTVFVVEDEPDVREVIDASLSELGYRILSASNAIEARRMLDADPTIDLLLTDVVMPNGVSGIGLAQMARELRRDIKILLVSGYPRGINGAAGGMSGDFVFLAKPFQHTELAAAVAAALGGASKAAPWFKPCGSGFGKAGVKVDTGCENTPSNPSSDTSSRPEASDNSSSAASTRSAVNGR